MLKNILTVCILGTSFLLGGNAIAENALNTHQKSIIAVASYTALGDEVGLSQALTQGLKAGVNIDTFKEILVQSYAYCGFPRSLNALNTLMKLAEKEAYQAPKKEELSSFTSGKSLELGTQNQTRLIGHPISDPIYDFAPAIDAFLKAHLFGDIFMQPTVNWQTHELATIAMLASLDKTESQLKSHIAIGKHNGLSDAAVDELLAEVKRLKAERVLFGFGEENTAYAPLFYGEKLSGAFDTGRNFICQCHI